MAERLPLGFIRSLNIEPYNRRYERVTKIGGDVLTYISNYDHRRQLVPTSTGEGSKAALAGFCDWNIEQISSLSLRLNELADEDPQNLLRELEDSTGFISLQNEGMKEATKAFIRSVANRFNHFLETLVTTVEEMGKELKTFKESVGDFTPLVFNVLPANGSPIDHR
jgi:hypothetical protein